MKKILFTLVMIVLCGFIFSRQAWARTFDQRQVRQQMFTSDGPNPTITSTDG